MSQRKVWAICFVVGMVLSILIELGSVKAKQDRIEERITCIQEVLGCPHVEGGQTNTILDQLRYMDEQLSVPITVYCNWNTNLHAHGWREVDR